MLVDQAAVLDGPGFDFLSPFDDSRVPAVIGIGGCYVFQALMVTAVVEVIDELVDLAFDIAWQVIVLQQDAVLEGLMPAFDLALGLRVIGCASNMVHFPVLKPLGQFTGDV